MKKRVLAVAEIKNRISNAQVALNLKSLHENIQRNLKLDELSAVCISEGIDEIIKKSSRDPRGFPMTRKVGLIIDLVVDSTIVKNIKQNLIDLREVILVDITPVVIDGIVDPTTYLSEEGIEGPFGYGVPDSLGIRLLLGLTYIDNGPY